MQVIGQEMNGINILNKQKKPVRILNNEIRKV